MRNILIILLFFSFISIIAIPLAQFQIPYFNVKESNSYDYFIQGVNLFNDNSYKTAQNFFLKSLNIKPDFYFARRFLAESYFLSGELENALEEYDILKNQFPNDEFINYKIKQIENQFFLMNQINHKNSRDYSLWKTIRLNELNLKRFIPVDISKDEHFIYCLSYEPKAIYIFDLEGNLKKTISGSIFNRIEKPEKIFITDDSIYLSDFGKDQIFVFNKNKFFPRKTLNVPYPSDILKINDILYIWSNKENRFYKFNKELQEIGYLNLQIPLDKKETLIFNQPKFAFYNDNIYMLNNNKIYKIDISGYILNETEIPFNNIQTFFINQEVFSVGSKNAIYYKEDNDWKMIENFDSNLNESNKLQKESFQYISRYYIDNNFLYVLDLSGAIYIFINSYKQTENIFLQIMNIESNQYPQIAVNLKITDKENQPIENLEDRNFEIYENDQRIYLINSKNINKFRNIKNILILKDANFQVQREYKDLFKEKLEKLFEEFKINDNVFFALGGDNIKIIYKNNYKIDLINLLFDNQLLEKKSNIIQNLIQSSNYLSSYKGKKCIILFTNETSSLSNDESLQNLYYFSNIHSIPIYIISFEKNPHLIEISTKTNGSYYYFFENYYYINIYKDLDKKPFYHYLITYEALAPYEKKFKNKYINVKINLKYLQFGGIAESGYVIP